MHRMPRAARAGRAVSASVVAVVLAALGSGPARAQLSGRAVEPDLRVEWSAGEDRRGRTLVSGYVYNERPGSYAKGVRLRVDAFDAAGQTVGSTTAYVMGDVPPSNRSYFEVKAPAKAAGFRITVLSYVWRGYGAGGG